MNNLKEALRSLFEDAEFIGIVASILDYASKAGKTSYAEVKQIAGENAIEVLLSCYEWRLLLPVKVEKSGAWEDRILRCKPEESYTVPKVVQHLLQIATKSGNWNPSTAIAETFKEMGEPDWRKIPELVMEMGKSGRGPVSGTQIKKICIGSGLGDKVDLMIAELKAAGITSPRLSQIAEVSKAGSPMYELNPALFITREQKDISNPIGQK